MSRGNPKNPDEHNETEEAFAEAAGQSGEEPIDELDRLNRAIMDALKLSGDVVVEQTEDGTVFKTSGKKSETD